MLQIVGNAVGREVALEFAPLLCSRFVQRMFERHYGEIRPGREPRQYLCRLGLRRDDDQPQLDFALLFCCLISRLQLRFADCDLLVVDKFPLEQQPQEALGPLLRDFARYFRRFVEPPFGRLLQENFLVDDRLQIFAIPVHALLLRLKLSGQAPCKIDQLGGRYAAIPHFGQYWIFQFLSVPGATRQQDPGAYNCR